MRIGNQGFLIFPPDGGFIPVLNPAFLIRRFLISLRSIRNDSSFVIRGKGKAIRLSESPSLSILSKHALSFRALARNLIIQLRHSKKWLNKFCILVN
jgi:hypothetical protein